MVARKIGITYFLNNNSSSDSWLPRWTPASDNRPINAFWPVKFLPSFLVISMSSILELVLLLGSFLWSLRPESLCASKAEILLYLCIARMLHRVVAGLYPVATNTVQSARHKYRWLSSPVSACSIHNRIGTTKELLWVAPKPRHAPCLPLVILLVVPLVIPLVFSVVEGSFTCTIVILYV